MLQAGQSIGGFAPGDVLGPPRRGLTVVYATDTRPCPAVLEAARGADLLCMDSTYADDTDLPKAKLYGHATCRETGALAAARTQYPEAAAGYDGLQLELEFDEG